jgi:hypothetical protein
MCGNCAKRLEQGKDHELFHRISEISPTHILVVHKDAERLWTRVSRAGTALADLINQVRPKPLVTSALHPSRGWTFKGWTREQYWDHVYERLSSLTQ